MVVVVVVSNWVYLAGDSGPGGSESGCGVEDWEMGNGNCWSEGEVIDSPRERLAMLKLQFVIL